MDDRAWRLRRNTMCNAIAQITGVICGFVTTRIILLLFSVERSGLVMSVSQFNAYFNFAITGLSGAAIYALFKPLTDKDYNLIGGILSQMKKYYNIGGLIIGGVNVLIAIIYPFMIPAEGIPPLEVRSIFLLIALCSVLELIFVARNAVLVHADQRSFIVSNSATLSYLVQMLLVYLLYLMKAGTAAICLTYLIAVLMRGAGIAFYLKKNYPQVSFRAVPQKGWASRQWDALYIQVMYFFQTVLPLGFTNLFTDLKTVSVYSTYNMVINGIQSLFIIVVSGITSLLGELIARQEMAMVQKTFKTFEFFFYMVVSVIYAVSFAIITFFVNIYTSGANDNNYDLPAVGFLFVLWSLFTTLQIPQTVLIQASGIYKETKHFATIQIVLLCLLSLPAAHFWGLPGILTASAATSGYRNIALLLYVPRKAAVLKTSERCNRQLKMALHIFLTVAPVSLLNLRADTIPSWILYATAVTLWSCFVNLASALIFQREELKNAIALLNLAGYNK